MVEEPRWPAQYFWAEPLHDFAHREPWAKWWRSRGGRHNILGGTPAPFRPLVGEMVEGGADMIRQQSRRFLHNQPGPCPALAAEGCCPDCQLAPWPWRSRPAGPGGREEEEEDEEEEEEEEEEELLHDDSSELLWYIIGRALARPWQPELVPRLPVGPLALAVGAGAPTDGGLESRRFGGPCEYSRSVKMFPHAKPLHDFAHREPWAKWWRSHGGRHNIFLGGTPAPFRPPTGGRNGGGESRHDPSAKSLFST
jgi:hypothetical protein